MNPFNDEVFRIIFTGAVVTWTWALLVYLVARPKTLEEFLDEYDGLGLFIIGCITIIFTFATLIMIATWYPYYTIIPLLGLGGLWLIYCMGRWMVLKFLKWKKGQPFPHWNNPPDIPPPKPRTIHNEDQRDLGSGKDGFPYN